MIIYTFQMLKIMLTFDHLFTVPNFIMFLKRINQDINIQITRAFANMKLH